MTVPVQLPADPTANLQASTKQYVDNSTANAWASAAIAQANVGVFSDNRSPLSMGLVSWPVEYVMTAAGMVLDSVHVSAQTPWLGCSTGGAVSVVDDLGNTLTTFNLLDSYGTGGSPYSYMAQVTKPVNALVASGAAFLIPKFTSPGGCSQGATGVKIDLGTHQILVSITPSPASVVINATQQFLAAVTGSTVTNDASVTWSVDGVVGGNSTVGTISTAGIYTAPAAAGTHVVGATANAATNSVYYVPVTVTGS